MPDENDMTTTHASVVGDAFLLAPETVEARLDVDTTTGLSDAEAARRLAADGPNELRGTPPVPTWRKILAQFQDPLIYLLLAAVAVSLVEIGRASCRERVF